MRGWPWIEAVLARALEEHVLS
jgi:hypothetical protein